MEKVYRHRKTGETATYKDGVIKSGNCSIETGVEPSSEFWMELTYEVLSFKSKRSSFYVPTLQKDGTYLDAPLMSKNGGGASLEWMLKEEEYYVTSVKRLSDNEIFTIKDKIAFKLVDRGVKEIVGIVFRDGNIWLQTDLKRPNYGMKLEYAKKVKESLFTTEDNIPVFKGMSYVKLNNYSDWSIVTGFVAESSHENYQGLKFSTEEAAEEYTLMNKPLLSLNDLLSVWGSDVDIERYKESPLFKNFKDLASGKI